MAHEKQRRYKLYESGLNEISGVVSTEYADLWEVVACNFSSSALYFQLFNTGSAPSNGDVPRRSYKVDAGTALSVSYAEGREYYDGASYSWSTAFETLATGSFEGVHVDIDWRGPHI